MAIFDGELLEVRAQDDDEETGDKTDKDDDADSADDGEDDDENLE